MSGFEWDIDIDKARMKAGKTRQVMNHCVDVLIPCLDRRRDWILHVLALNPELPEILQPEMPEEHHFKYIARFFKLKFNPEKDVWRLCFVRFVKEPPPDGGAEAQKPDQNGAGGTSTGGAQSGAGGATEEESGGVASLRAIVQPILLSAQRIAMQAYRQHVAPRFGALREALRRLAWAGRVALDRVEDELIEARAMLHLRRVRASASLTQLMRDCTEAAVQAARPVSRLELRRVQLGPHQSMEMYELVSEKPDWGSWLFGRPLEDEAVFE